jgi:hypothetical protein
LHPVPDCVSGSGHDSGYPSAYPPSDSLPHSSASFSFVNSCPSPVLALLLIMCLCLLRPLWLYVDLVWLFVIFVLPRRRVFLRRVRLLFVPL